MLSLSSILNFIEKRIAFLVICFLFISHFSFAQENPWEENKSKEGIIVSSREKSSEKTKAFRAEMELEANVELLVATIKDASLGTKWINRAVKFETLDELSNKEWYSYTEISIPWPFLNKDLITHNVLNYDSAASIAEIEMISKPKYIPEKDGLSRLQHSEGVWRFENLGEGKVVVSYEVFARSSGGLPAWIVNPIIVHGLFVTLRDLREVVQEKASD